MTFNFDNKTNMITFCIIWKKQYEEMKERIESAIESGKIPKETKDQHKGFSEWGPHTTKHDHQSIVQVILFVSSYFCVYFYYILFSHLFSCTSPDFNWWKGHKCRGQWWTSTPNTSIHGKRKEASVASQFQSWSHECTCKLLIFSKSI